MVEILPVKTFWFRSVIVELRLASVVRLQQKGFSVPSNYSEFLSLRAIPFANQVPPSASTCFTELPRPSHPTMQLLIRLKAEFVVMIEVAKMYQTVPKHLTPYFIADLEGQSEQR